MSTSRAVTHLWVKQKKKAVNTDNYNLVVVVGAPVLKSAKKGLFFQ